jgi:MoaA/NifB/PqqE/SkfB family radical SAM enzyme
MIRLAKQAGCQVGTTTNGMLLDDRILTALVDLEVDLVAFSLAGTDEKNDVWRRGTRLTTVLQAARTLRRIKEEKGKTRPEIHVAYMLLRSGMPGVLRLPSLLEGSGVTQVVVSTLDFAASAELATEALVPATEPDFPEFLAKLDDLARSAKEHGLHIHHQLNRREENQQVCSENVQRALVVSAYGEVSPCAFTSLPVSGVTYTSRGLERPYRRLAFGNVREDSLAAIWERWAYLAFRNSFYEGNLASVCRLCPKL